MAENCSCPNPSPLSKPDSTLHCLRCNRPIQQTVMEIAHAEDRRAEAQQHDSTKEPPVDPVQLLRSAGFKKSADELQTRLDEAAEHIKCLKKRAENLEIDCKGYQLRAETTQQKLDELRDRLTRE